MTNIFKANKTVKRIKTLQKELHDSSLAYLLAQDIGFFPENKKRQNQSGSYARF